MKEPCEQRHEWYDAFISYRHVDRDRAWAKWLIDALETYSVPRALRRRGFPPRINRVFRDEDELPTSADLNESVLKAIQASRFLIVVCSRETPRSLWVDKEVQTFHALGRRDRVLVLLVDGEPGDAFPPSLRWRPVTEAQPNGTPGIAMRESEPLAADVRPRQGETERHLKRMAVLRLMACLLGCSFDDLRQRDHERRARQRRLWVAVLAVLVVVASGFGLWKWDQTRLKTRFFRHMVSRWGVPEGLGAVSEGERSHRVETFRFEYRGGKVVRVVRENSAGVPGLAEWKGVADDPSAGNEVSIWEVEYLAKGRVARWLCRKHTGALVRREEYGPDISRIDFKDQVGGAKPQAVPTLHLSYPLEEATSEVTQHRVRYDERGFVVQRLFRNAYGDAQRDAEGSYGEAYEVSPEGLVERTWSLDANGAPLVHMNGVGGTRFTYDGNRDTTREEFVGVGGDVVLHGEKRYAVRVCRYDCWGNLTDVEFHDACGEPIFMKPCFTETGYARVSYRYNDQGDPIEIRFFGAKGKPVVVEGYARQALRYNERGLPIEIRYLNANGGMVLNKWRYARLTVEFDERGNVVKSASYGVDGEPISRKGGYARDVLRYDQDGNPVERSFFGVRGEPVLTSQGVFRYATEYDDHGRMIDERCYGVDGRPVLSAEGCARITCNRNSIGKIVEMTFYGVDGEPIRVKQGYARLVTRYDSRGNRIESRAFGVHGEPTESSMGYSWETLKVDDQGREVDWACFGVDGKPASHILGFARITTRYDSRGNTSEQAVFGVDGKPTTTPEGFCRRTFRHDDRGNLTETAYFDRTGAPVMIRDGYHRVKLEYDELGRATSESYFGIDGESVLQNGGFARLLRRFDARGDLVEESYLGADGKSIALPAGYARQTFRHDPCGRTIEVSHLGLDGGLTNDVTGCARMTHEYNALGALVRTNRYDAAGNRLKRLRDFWR